MLHDTEYWHPNPTTSKWLTRTPLGLLYATSSPRRRLLLPLILLLTRSTKFPARTAQQPTTARPVIKRIKEHEACYITNNISDDLTGRIESAPAHHARTTGHTIDCNSTTILTSTRTRSQFDLTEHAAIQMRKPRMNRHDKAPACNFLWNPILPKIVASIRPKPAGLLF